ncbi:MAG: rhodanese-like domain-containing protein [Gloeocapsa sp. DLM2.Bin57]|nr:MAG: rhodanese-like domain-containing protein [Gloeocapsa sp. DLM2.Bin57]
MILKSFILAIACCLCLLSGNAFSLPLNTATPSQEILETIDQFLSTLPGDYYTIQKIDKLKKIDNALFIDVREPSEYLTGHIPGAINIPLGSLTDNLTQIPQKRPVILYCSTGYRTGIGVTTLQLLGYSNVRGFPPSIRGWKNAGESLEMFPEKVAKIE